MRKPPGDNDALLGPLLLAEGHEQIDGLLSQLITASLEPVVRAVISYKLHFDFQKAAEQAEADDIRQEVIVQLLASLRKLRHNPEENSIRDVRGLAAVIAHRSCARWMRRRFPERHALKNRLYYLITRQSGFALWENENKKLVAGFAAWKGQETTATSEQLKSVSEDGRLLRQISVLRTARKHAESSEILEAIFNHLGCPVEFDALISVMAAMLFIRDQPVEPADLNENEIALSAGNERRDTAWQVEKRIFLQRLWEEIGELPQNQRAALLLNLRDAEGRGCIALFPAAGIATVRQLAESVGTSAEEFAALFSELPLDDNGIAERLGLTRQQVINARKSARERLTRRLKGFM